MLFEKEKYYKYIGTLEKMINFSYVVFIGLGMLFGVAGGKGTGLIIGGLLGFLISTVYTLNTKIKVQEMKWKMDVYEKIRTSYKQD